MARQRYSAQQIIPMLRQARRYHVFSFLNAAPSSPRSCADCSCAAEPHASALSVWSEVAH